MTRVLREGPSAGRCPAPNPPTQNSPSPATTVSAMGQGGAVSGTATGHSLPEPTPVSVQGEGNQGPDHQSNQGFNNQGNCHQGSQGGLVKAGTVRHHARPRGASRMDTAAAVSSAALAARAAAAAAYAACAASDVAAAAAAAARPPSHSQSYSHSQYLDSGITLVHHHPLPTPLVARVVSQPTLPLPSPDPDHADVTPPHGDVIPSGGQQAGPGARGLASDGPDVGLSGPLSGIPESPEIHSLEGTDALAPAQGATGAPLGQGALGAASRTDGAPGAAACAPGGVVGGGGGGTPGASPDGRLSSSGSPGVGDSSSPGGMNSSSPDLPNASPASTMASQTSSNSLPPDLCPEADGGICGLRMSARTHFLLMKPIRLGVVATGLAYLGWKTYMVGTNFLSSGPTCVMFLACELLVFLSSLMLILELAVPAKKRKAVLVPSAGPFPTVAILICCCKEPVDIIQDTVKGALNQTYPSTKYTVWVLDDGGDDELKAWVEGEAVEMYGAGRVRYLRRTKPKGVPHHFKAGNINHGLQHASGEFIAILDADMIPSKYFLSSLLPHFTAPDIAFVQCPQSFYNIVKGDPLNDASQDFYDVLLPHRDGRDSAQCVGTGVIMRASCLRENGGFTLGSVTEDFDTALSLHSRGYKTVYMDQRLQAGLAPWSLEGYVKQHQRWATGSLQILLHRNPLLIRDHRFSLYHRISYWYAGAQYYMNVVVLVILVLPLLILLLDLPIMPQNGGVLLTRLYIILLVPYVLSSRLLCYTLFCRLPNSFMVQIRGEQAWYWMSFYNCVAIAKFFFPCLSRTFQATGAATGQRQALLLRLRIVWFHLLFCTAAIGVVVWSALHVDYRDCGKLLKVTSWAPYILFTIQTMSVPILYVLLANGHPKPEDRRKYISYDDQGVPYLTRDQILPKKDPRVLLFNVVPALWATVVLFYFYAAITDYRPGFCTTSGFFEHQRF